MSWFYENADQVVGPVPDAEFARLATVGTITAKTLVWREDLAGWQPRSSVVPVAPVGGHPALPLVGGETSPTVICQDCGGRFAISEVVLIAGATVSRAASRCVCKCCTRVLWPCPARSGRVVASTSWLEMRRRRSAAGIATRRSICGGCPEFLANLPGWTGKEASG